MQAGGRAYRGHGGRDPTTIYDVKADIYAPCALGAIINDDTLKRLKVAIIAGGANNQLAEERHGDALERQGILYAPDYVINGGGVINVYGELQGWTWSGPSGRRGRSTTPCCGSTTGRQRRRSRPTWPPTGSRRSGSSGRRVR